ncbi:MAG: magnesium/cobalt transporter CorA [Bacteroidetes bacterium]|nr:magnesium/cobalt transporter CorA [Bacteroidota bacterium]MBS1929850.1 magnesium/cobalt transporter CorA [Bacteroidota bacterium]
MNVKKIRPSKYLRYLYPLNLFGTQRTKEILSVNPTAVSQREEAADVFVTIYDYDTGHIEEKKLTGVSGCLSYKSSGRISWINIDGLRKADVELVCNHFEIHPLFAEDILSTNQRPKMDEADNHLFCLLNMLYYNNENRTVEQEQISIIIGKDYVISFQEDAKRDVFNPLRDRLRSNNSRIRQRGADYLCYNMLDLIIDNYFLVMEQLGEAVELLEEEVVRSSNKITLGHINQLRKELIVLKRNIPPVRELVNGFIRSDSDLLEDRTTKYFKDVYDHIVQANDLTENYRDMMINMHDLYINNVNLKLNEVMKVMAIVTCLLAPATVIGGIFGMNFQTIPWLHNPYGFFIAVGFMLLIPVWMLWVFRRRGWF